MATFVMVDSLPPASVLGSGSEGIQAGTEYGWEPHLEFAGENTGFARPRSAARHAAHPAGGTVHNCSKANPSDRFQLPQFQRITQMGACRKAPIERENHGRQTLLGIRS